MRACILRKVVVRPLHSDRLTYGIVLGQSEGLSLVFIPRRRESHSHSLALCEENIEERLFEPVRGPQFALEDEDLSALGHKLSCLGEAVSEIKARDLLEDL